MASGPSPSQDWEVELLDLGGGEDALSELAESERLTDKQIAQINGGLERLARHGPDLDGDYFDNVEGSARGLKEFRLSANRVEIRFLYKLRGRTFVMLKGYKHTRPRDVRRHIKPAEARLDEWDRTHEAR